MRNHEKVPYSDYESGGQGFESLRARQLFQRFSLVFRFLRNSQAVGYAVRARLIWLGLAARVWRILQPCFLAVETTDRRRAKIWAPSRVRNDPEIFILALLLPRPIARTRLGAVRAVLAQLPAKRGHFSAKRRDLALQRSNQLLDFGGKNHPTLDSRSRPAVSKNPPIKTIQEPFQRNRGIPDSSRPGSCNSGSFGCKPLISLKSTKKKVWKSLE